MVLKTLHIRQQRTVTTEKWDRREGNQQSPHRGARAGRPGKSGQRSESRVPARRQLDGERPLDSLVTDQWIHACEGPPWIWGEDPLKRLEGTIPRAHTVLKIIHGMLDRRSVLECWSKVSPILNAALIPLNTGSKRNLKGLNCFQVS